MRVRARLAVGVLAVVLAAVVQLSVARATATGPVPGRDARSLVEHSSRWDSAVVPVNVLVRSGRAVGELLGVPLVDVVTLASLLALWFTAAVRRRRHLATAVVTYRRRGPPRLLPVD